MDRSFWRSHGLRLGLVLVALSASSLTGCVPKIGDHCVLNTDCGTSGALVCDTSMPGGYCTQFNCTPDVCQNEAACVAFEEAVPGCPYDDYHSPSRTERTYCLAQCHHDSDCRSSYVCADPRQPPWNGAIVDDDQAQTVCIPPSSAVFEPLTDASLPEGSVCLASGPQLDASFPYSPEYYGEEGGDAVAEASPVDATGTGPDAPLDVSVSVEASFDAPAEVGTDATLSEGGVEDAAPEDAAVDGSSEGGADGGVVDAAGGG